MLVGSPLPAPGLPRPTTRPVPPARPVIIERVSGQPLGTFLGEGVSGSALLMRVLDWPVTGIGNNARMAAVEYAIEHDDG